jgi:hypothetical protein
MKTMNIYFTQYLNENPDVYVSGYVQFDDESETHEIWYETETGYNDSIHSSGIATINEELILALEGFDLIEYCELYDENEFGIYNLEEITLVINPETITEPLLNTLICWKWGWSDSIWQGTLPRNSIQELLDELCGTWNLYIKDSPMTAYVKWDRKGYENHKLLKINYGDAEIAEGVESAIKRIVGMTFVNKVVE